MPIDTLIRVLLVEDDTRLQLLGRKVLERSGRTYPGAVGTAVVASITNTFFRPRSRTPPAVVHCM